MTDTPPKKRSILRKNTKRANPKSGKARKAKRRETKVSEAEKQAKDVAASRDHWDGSRADQLLLRKAINKRWQTDITARQAADSLTGENRDSLPLKKLAMVIIRKGLVHEDLRVNQHAVTNLLRAEQQNQADEHKEQPDKVDLTLSGSPEERVADVLGRLEAEMVRRGINPRNGRKKAASINGK